MQTRLELLKKVTMRRIRAKKRGNHCKKTQSTIGSTICGRLVSALFDESGENAAGLVGWELEINDVERRELSNPLNQSMFALWRFADGLKYRRKILATIT